MKLSIGRVLYLSFSTVLVLMFIASLVVWQKQNTSVNIATEVAEDDVPGVLLYLQLLDEMGDMSAEAMAYTLGRPNSKSNFESNYQEFKKFHQQLVPLESSTPEQRQLLDKAINNINKYKQDIERNVFDVYSYERELNALALYKKTRFEVGGQLKALLTTQKNAALNAVDQQFNKENVDLLRYILEIEDETDDLLTFLGKYVSGDDEARRYFEEDAKEYQQYLNKLQGLIAPQAFQSIVSFKQTIVQY